MGDCEGLKRSVGGNGVDSSCIWFSRTGYRMSSRDADWYLRNKNLSLILKRARHMGVGPGGAGDPARSDGSSVLPEREHGKFVKCLARRSWLGSVLQRLSTS